jgi:serine/threonine protein kinase/tetratricopeptide (TPR) repeat protein
MASSTVARLSCHTVRPGDEPVPGFRLIQRVGRGGAGEVWRAEGPGGLPVALKLVRLGSRLGSRELSNLHILRAIRHPNLLAYFGAWTDEHLLILGMELADQSLWDLWREHAARGLAGIPRIELLEILAEAAGVIDFLHEPRHQLDGRTGIAILHRDIKPKNLMLLGRGVKVADFGLSTLVEQGSSNSGHAGLTSEYASPETFRGEARNESDQYALAVTYCVLRGGRPPFVGPAPVVMFGHLFRPPDLSMLPEVERPVVERALAKSPGDRWPDCRRFIAALGDCPSTEAPEQIPAADGQPPWLGEAGSAFVVRAVNLEAPTGVLSESCEPDDPSAYVLGSEPLDQTSPPGSSWEMLQPSAEAAPREGVGPSAKALVVRGIGCLLLGCLGAWVMMLLGAASGRPDERVPEPSAAFVPVFHASALASGGVRAADRLLALDPPAPLPQPEPSRNQGVPGPPTRSDFKDAKRALVAALHQLLRTSPAWLASAQRRAAKLAWTTPQSIASSGTDRAATTTVPASPPLARDPSPSGGVGPAYSLELPANVTMEAGKSKPLMIAVSRRRATGPILVQFEALPAGVSSPAVLIPKWLDRAEGRLSAGVKTVPARIKLQVTATSGTEHVERSIALVVLASPTWAHGARGHELLAVGKPAEAATALSYALALDSPDAVVLNNRGLAYARLGRCDAAIADYTEALTLSPRDAVIRCNRGCAYASQGQAIRALLDFDTAIRLNPGYSTAYRGRAMLLARQGDLAGAAADQAKADALDRGLNPGSTPPAASTCPAGTTGSFRDLFPAALDRTLGL